MVGRLVEEQRRRAGEEDAGQLDPSPLAAGEGAERLVEDPVVKAERRGDPCGLGLRRIPALGVERRVEPLVAPHRLLANRVVLRGHELLGGPQVADDRVEPARGEDAVAGQHGEVAGARVLWEVAHVARPRHGAGRRLGLAGEHLGERRLAGAVAPDQPDAVARGDAEGRAVEEEPRTGAQLDPRGHDHNRRFCQCGLRGPNRFPQGPVLSPTVTRAIEVRTVDAAQHLAFVEARSGSFLQTPAWGRLKTDWRGRVAGLVPGRRARWSAPAWSSTGASLASAAPSPTCPRARSPTGTLPRRWTCCGPCATTSRPRAPSPCGSVRRSRCAAGTPTPSRRRSPTTPSAPLRDVTPDVTEDAGMRVRALLERLGFDHLASDDGFAAGQPEYVFQLPLAGRTEEDVLAGMNQLWRRNIKKSAKQGVVVTRGEASDLPAFHTRIRRDRHPRPLHAAAALVLPAHVRGHGGRERRPHPALPRPPRRATSSRRRRGSASARTPGTPTAPRPRPSARSRGRPRSSGR